MPSLEKKPRKKIEFKFEFSKSDDSSNGQDDVPQNGRQRVIIERLTPEIDGGRFPIKRVAGDSVTVTASVFTDGHDQVLATLLYRKRGEKTWQSSPMTFLGNDQWTGAFTVSDVGDYEYTVSGCIDHLMTWQKDLKKRIDAKQDVSVDMLIGANLVEHLASLYKGADAKAINALAADLRNSSGKPESASVAFSAAFNRVMTEFPDKTFAAQYERTLHVTVDTARAGFSTWYEFFPRSWSKTSGKHGTFKDCEQLLPEIATMGFDVIYLPPIHPIGSTKRKGKNNNTQSQPGEPGSPWAIGSKDGGHKAIHPELGTINDFQNFVKAAEAHGISVALDIAFQCSPDHPYVKEHPDWFKQRPDGTIQYAENPPKKYEDVFPFNFETDDWENLWYELKSVFEFWIKHGVTIFRVDNPHTKPLPFWEWCISEIKQHTPEAIFLSEAFTRPSLTYRLAKGGFSHAYTYFTWRNSKKQLETYLTELTTTELSEFFRPNFWPNTPDILSEEFLHHAPRAAFMLRYILAATLSSNIGIYGPAYELCINTPFVKGKEEYMDSEKYELKAWNWNAEGNIKPLISTVNRIRKENPALHTTNNLYISRVETSPGRESEHILAYLKTHGRNAILTVVSHDPHHAQSGWVRVPLERLNIAEDQEYTVNDLLTGNEYIWKGEWNFVMLDPNQVPAHIFRVEVI
jgi:starch synthase (maltosyl-transferring)